MGMMAHPPALSLLFTSLGLSSFIIQFWDVVVLLGLSPFSVPCYHV